MSCQSRPTHISSVLVMMSLFIEHLISDKREDTLLHIFITYIISSTALKIWNNNHSQFKDEELEV